MPTLLLRSLLLLALLCSLVAWLPELPSHELDPSWMFGLNQATAQHLSFGRELVFTYGPYASVYTKTYHPATDGLMLFGGMLFALGLWVCLDTLLGLVEPLSRRQRFLWALIGVLAIPLSMDAFIFSYAFAAVLATAALSQRLTVSAQADAAAAGLAPRERRWVWGRLLLIHAGLALLPLIKISAIVACVAAAGLSLWLLMRARQPGAAAWVLGSLLFCASLLWLGSGQEWADLLRFPVATLGLMAGFSAAMSKPGPVHDYVLFGVFSLGILIYLGKGVWKDSKIVAAGILLMLALSLFLMFRAGFTRHDQHALIAFHGLWLLAVLCGIFVAPGTHSPWVFRGLFAGTLALVVLGSARFDAVNQEHVLQALEARSQQTQPLSDREINARKYFSIRERYGLLATQWGAGEVIHSAAPLLLAQLSYVKAWAGVQDRLEGQRLAARHQQTLEQLRQRANIPLLAGSTDIYPNDQSLLLASGNQWNPRPVFQSYSAYTVPLAEMNRQHLLGPNAPDNLIFKIHSIDGRPPAMDDGVSWPALFENYALDSAIDDFLVLKHRAQPAASPARVEAPAQDHQLGDRVAVPAHEQALMVQIKPQASLWGTVQGLLLRNTELVLELHLRNGQSRRYRLVPAMAQSGFLLSPLVENTEDFKSLYLHPERLDDKRVSSLSVFTADGSTLGWKSTLAVGFQAVALPARRP